jgi:hypothetical protein
MHVDRAALRVLLACAVAGAVAPGCETRSSAPALPRADAPGRAAPAGPPARARPSGLLPSFRIVGRESGLDFERFDDMQGQRRIVEANGGGVALFDFDRDGALDVFLTNGCRLPRKLRDRGRRSELFRNVADLSAGNAGHSLRFERATDESRLVQFGYSHGCAVGDFDADGFDDLYVTAFGPNSLWRNNGDGTFSDWSGLLPGDVPHWSSSAAFADLNGDGHLDLYVVNYLDESDERPTLCPHAVSPDGYISCPPAKFEGVDDVLFLSRGGEQFLDATAASGVAGLRGKGLGVVVADLGGDPRPEIYVANDGEPNFLFVQAETSAEAGGPSGIRFEERGLASGTALNEAGYAQAGMGVAAGDYDASGTLDLFLTHFYDDTNTLYRNRGDFAFVDATRSSGLGPPSRRMLGWGTAFLDVDNDGWLDLLVANGHVEDRTWESHEEPYAMRPQLFRNERTGGFADVSDWSGDYFARDWLGRGLAVGDLDRDGRVDAAINHQLAPSVALRNETQTSSAALTLRFVGSSSNRNGYQVRVEVVDARPAVVRELVGGSSYHSASAPEIHLGLGPEQAATIRVAWPSGVVETHRDLQPGEWILVENWSRAIRSSH